MNSKLATVILAGFVSCTLAMAQTEADNGQSSDTTATNAMATTESTEAATNEATDTMAEAATAEATNAMAEAAAPATTGEPAPAAEPTTTATEPSATAATENAAPQTDEVIPLIQFQDVQLTTAIENLARQAGINYILDPKIGYGQLDERGQPIPQPSISIRWENVTAGQALLALLDNYGLQEISDPKTKIARIAKKDPTAPPPLITKIIQLKFAGASNMVSAVQATFTDKRSKVIADVRSSQLVISATEKEQDEVQKLIDRLDTQTKQVLVEAKILETTLNPKSNKGIDWSGTLGAQNFSFGNGSSSGDTTTTAPGAPTTVTTPGGRTVGTTGSSYDQSTTIGTVLGSGGLSYNTLSGLTPGIGFLNADGVSAALSFLNSSSDTKVVSEPRMVTLDNQKATIDVGLLFPIVNTTAGTANTTGGSQITYSNLTVNLDVTPRITANNFIELKVQQGVLRLGPLFNSTVGGVNNSVNSFLSRRLDTTVLIPSGNTLVMGGLISDEKINANTKVPVLGDIPGLGLLFRKDSKELNRNNLIIFITPTVVQNSDFQPAHTDYLKSTGQEEVKENWSFWDSGKPWDWSKRGKETETETETSPAATSSKPKFMDVEPVPTTATEPTSEAPTQP